MTEQKTSTAKGFTVEAAAYAFSAYFLDEQACRAWVIKFMHGEGPGCCPECNAELQGRAAQSFWQGRRVRCQSCGKMYTAMTGTAFNGMHADYRELYFIAVCLGLGLTNQKISERIGYSSEAVRLIRRRFDMLQVIQEHVNKSAVGA